MALFEKGQSGNPLGRPKGIPNKLSMSAKELIAMAADELGGVDRLVSWAREDPANERLFWGTIYTKLVGAGGTKDDPMYMEHTLSSLNAVYDRIHAPAETEVNS